MNLIARAFSVLVVALLPLAGVAQTLGQQSLSYSSYIVTADGNLYSWGANENGQLGIGNITNQNTPVLVPWPSSIDHWTLVAGGQRHALALGDSDKLFAFGSNDDGELGNGSTTARISPAAITNPSGVTAWKAISAGADHSVAITSRGEMYAWGGNANGQLGTGNTNPARTPTLVIRPAAVKRWIQCAAGPHFTLAIGDDGRLYGWGADSASILGTGKSENATPFAINLKTGTSQQRLLSPYFTLSASTGAQPAAAIDADGTAQPFGEQALAMIALGGAHRAALHSDGTLTTTGSNRYGQLGLGDYSARTSPVTIGFPSGVTQWLAIAAGALHTLALGNDGKLYAWGDNQYGELGDGTGANQPLPVLVRQFGSSSYMNISLSVPDTLRTASTSIHLQMTTAYGLGLGSPTAYLVLNSSASLTSAGPLVALTPSTVTTSTPGTASWDIAILDTNFQKTGGTIGGFILSSATNTSSRLTPLSIIVPGTKDPNNFTVRVIDSLTGKPISGATIQWHDIYGYRFFTTTELGLLKYHPDFTGPITLFAGAENYRSSLQNVSVDPTTPLTVTFLLGPAPLRGGFRHTGYLPATPFSILQFISSANGFGLRDQKNIFVTSDSGAHWLPLATLPVNCIALQFLNSKYGYATAENGLILESNDSGKTWIFVPSGTSKTLRAIAVVKDTEGYAVGDDGTVCVRNAKGWMRIDSDAVDQWKVIAVPSSKHFLSIADIGHAGVYSDGDFATSPYDISNPTSLVFVGSQEWFAVGSAGLFSSETASSNALPMPTGDRLLGSVFVTPEVGFVATRTSSPFVTYNGGLQTVPVSVPFANGFDLVAGYGVDLYSNSPIGGLFHLHGIPAPGKAIITGRISRALNDIPAIGCYVYRMQGSQPTDSAWTNAMGVYTFLDVAPGGADLVVRYKKADSLISAAIPHFNAKPDSIHVKDFVIPSGTAGVAIRNSSNEFSMTTSPNPASAYLHVACIAPGEGSVQLALIDALGREVLRATNAMSSSQSDGTLDVRSVAPGIYFLHAKSNGRELISRVAIIR